MTFVTQWRDAFNDEQKQKNSPQPRLSSFLLFSFHTHLLCPCLLLFYDSGERKIPFPQEHRHFLSDGGQRHDRNPPPPPPQKISPIKIALRGQGLVYGWVQAIYWGQFSEEQFSQFQPQGSRISRLNFLPLKTELLHGGIHTHLKGLVGFNLLFLFYSQQKKDSLNMSNFFYHLTFQPQEKYSNIFKDKKKKKKRSMIIKK